MSANPSEAPSTADAVWANFATEAGEAEQTPAVVEPPAEEPKPVETPAETPAEPTEQSAPEQVADPFAAITNPTPDDFKKLLDARQQVNTQLTEVKPLLDQVTALGGPMVLEAIAPLFKPVTGANPQEQEYQLVSNATEALSKIKNHDPQLYQALGNAYYNEWKDSYYNWSLADRGVDPQKFEAFKEWETSGKIPSGYAPIPGTFPSPNEQGDVILPDGTELNIGDARDKLLYNMAKEKFERETAEAKAKTEAAQAAEQTQREQLRQSIEKANTEYLAARDLPLDTALAELNQKLEFGTENPKVMRRLHGTIRSMMESDQNISNWTSQALGAVARGANGVAQSLAVQIDRRTLEILEEAKKEVLGDYRELFDLRQVARKGQPRIPLTTTVAPPNGQAPPTTPPRTAEDFWNQAVSDLPE